MIYRFPIIAFLILVHSLAGADVKKQIHSHLPAAKWEDAMVSGNGLSGVMVYGGQPEETFVFTSHKFIRPGNGRDPIPDMADMVEPMREKMLAGEIGGGWKLYWDEWQKRSKSGMVWTQSFHPGYQLNLQVIDGSYPVKYKRSTDFQTAVVTTEYTDGFGNWTRETFSSRDQDIIVTRLGQSDGGKKMSIRLKTAACDRQPKNITTESNAENGFISFRAKYPKDSYGHAGYEGLTRVVHKGGRVRAGKGSIEIYGADEILLITGLERYAKDHSEWNKGELKKRLNAIDADYESLLKAHVDIHKPIYDRVNFSLDADVQDRAKSTEELIADEQADQKGINVALLERLFYTSRYLFMASSGEYYAPRLSGMFIGAWGAAWAGDYTLDANANMAVMGGNIGNMPEMMRGYQSIIERTLPQWREGAKKLYGMRGILGPVRIDGEVAVPHHISFYHAHCTATGLGPWIIYPLWEQYEITGDKEFLKETLYPIMKEQMDFYEDFLTKKDQNGKLIFVPSNSPENAWEGVQPRTSASINSTMDISACRQLLTNLLQAERDLSLPETEKAKELLSQLPPYLVNKDGALQEWSWPGHGENYSHRHASHVYCLWPGYDVNPESKEFAHFVPTMVKGLEKRDHRIIQAHDFIQRAIGWLRLKRGDEFYKILKYTLENNYLYSSLATSHDLNHRIYNYDYILSLQGMLMETAIFTHPGFMEILPALPEQLKSGEFAGVKGRNRCTIHKIKWDLEKGTAILDFTSDIDQTLTFIHRKGIKKITTSLAVGESEYGPHAREMSVKAGVRNSLELSF